MHQIVCRLGLRPRPHWGSLQPSPDSLAGIGCGASRGKGRREEGERKDGRGREGTESQNAQIHSWQAYTCTCWPIHVSVTETYIGELFHSTIDSIMNLMIDFYRHADPLREHVNVVVFSDNLINHFNC